MHRNYIRVFSIGSALMNRIIWSQGILIMSNPLLRFIIHFLIFGGNKKRILTYTTSTSMVCKEPSNREGSRVQVSCILLCIYLPTHPYSLTPSYTKGKFFFWRNTKGKIFEVGPVKSLGSNSYWCRHYKNGICLARAFTQYVQLWLA